tara:strand:+ start:1269 stop:1427 length:159 start_codon:yes stop_codon:yes gene_type:complete
MSKDKNETPRTEEDLNKEIASETWSNWLDNLEEKEQPTCSIDSPEDCEACGS